jgi:hypothetical protein
MAVSDSRPVACAGTRDREKAPPSALVSFLLVRACLAQCFEQEPELRGVRIVQFEVLGTLDRPLKLCPCFVVPPQLHERHGEVISGLAVLDGMLIGVFIVAEKSQA